MCEEVRRKINGAGRGCGGLTEKVGMSENKIKVE